MKGLAEQTGGDVRFARDAYRRFIQMFGKIVMDVPADAFEDALDRGEGAPRARTRRTPTSTPTTCAALTGRFLDDLPASTPATAFPTEPRDQLRLAIEAVFKCWNGKRASDYRRQNKISDDLGTAVNVVVDGVRQPRRRLRHGCGVHARPVAPARRCRTATTSRTRRARTSWRASATRCRSRSSRSSTRRRTRSCAR